MMVLETRYSPNRGDIAAKVLDGEAIMIDLAKGIYYSLGGIGGRIWELIESERSPAEIAATIGDEFDVAGDRARSDVERILRELLSEGVIRSAPGGEGIAQPTEPTARLVAKQPYETPKLSVYRDMADLLALEPPTPGAEQEDLWDSTSGEGVESTRT